MPSCILLYFLLLSILPAQTLHFKDGSHLSGNILSLDKRSTLMASPLSKSPLQLSTNSLQYLKKESSSKHNPQLSDFLYLTNGDAFACRVLQLDTQRLSLALSEDETLSIPRLYLKKIFFNCPPITPLLTGTKQDEKLWKDARSHNWKIQGRRYEAKGYGEIFATWDKLPDSLWMSFLYSWSQRPALGINLYALGNHPRRGCIQVILNQSGIHVYHHTKTKQSVNHLASSPTDRFIKKCTTPARIELRFERRSGLLSVFLDGKLSLKTQLPAEVEYGNKIGFLNLSSNRKNCLIENLSISNLPRPLFKEAILPQSKQDLFIDNDGEFRTGKILTLETQKNQASLRIQTPYTQSPLEVPRTLIDALYFQNPDKEAIKEGAIFYLDHLGILHASDVRFHRAKWIFKHPLFGKTILPDYLVSHIQFQTPEGDKSIKKPPYSILFSNGDTLGMHSFSQQTPDTLTFSSSNLAKPTRFPLSLLKSLYSSEKQRDKQVGLESHIYLIPSYNEEKGDIIKGEWLSLNKEALQLSLDPALIPLQIDPQSIQKIHIVPLHSKDYISSDSSTSWKSIPQGDWDYNQGTFYTRQEGTLYHAFEPHDAIHLHFRIRWTTSLRIIIYLYGEGSNNNAPSFCLALSETFINLITRYFNPDNSLAIKSGTNKQLDKKYLQKGYADFDIYLDKLKGTLYLYANGEHIAVFQSGLLNPSGMGKELCFKADGDGLTALSDITLEPWDGASFTLNQEALFNELPEGFSDALFLKNGDFCPAQVLQLKDKQLLIASPHKKKLSLPLQILDRLYFTQHHTSPRKYAQDIRMYSSNGQRITARLDRVKGKQLELFHTSLGKISLPIALFSRIDFNLYTKKKEESSSLE